MEVVQERVTIPADRSNLAGLRETLRKLCKQFEIRHNTMRRLVLAIDEATSNIMEHSRVPRSSPIAISLEIGEDGIVAQLTDTGIEFDSSKCRKTLASKSLRLKRGFGLYLIHLITDKVEYDRADGKNILTLTIENR